MQNKLISIIIGAVLIIGTGTMVYTTKKPVLLPAEDSISDSSVIGDGQNLNTKTSIPTNTSAQTSTVKYKSNDEDDEDEGDDDDIKSGGTTTTVSTPKPATPTPTPTATVSGGVTLATIAKHNSSASCWSAVNGNVYDLTSWIPNHPGGEKTILSMCGVDGSSGYNGQHGSSSKPARIIGGFKIGVLAK